MNIEKIFFRIKKLVRPWLIIAIIATGYCLLVLAQHSWDPMSFVLPGSQFNGGVGELVMGYDGQFAYQIAINPGNAAQFLDVPAYRYQRILYPILAYGTSLGSAAIIPWMLIVINLISLVAGTLATEKILKDHGFSRWYAIAYGLFAGLLISLRLDLTEPLAFALIQWGVLLMGRGKIWRSLPFFALAALGRELIIPFSFACFLYLFFHGRRATSILWGFLSILPFVVWQIFLRTWLGEWGIHSGGNSAAPIEIIPFRGLWRIPITDLNIGILLILMVILIALLPAAISIFVSARKLLSGHYGLGVFILLINALIFLFLPASNLMNITGLVRTTIGLMIAVLDFGALENSKRALNYAQLWLILVIFGEGLIAYY